MRCWAHHDGGNSRGIRGMGTRRRVTAIAILLLSLAALLVALSMWRYSLIALGTDQGRLLFPAIGPLALLLAVGLAQSTHAKGWCLAGKRFGRRPCPLWQLYGLIGVIEPTFAPLPPPTLEEVAEAAPPGSPLPFGELSLERLDIAGQPRSLLARVATAQPRSAHQSAHHRRGWYVSLGMATFPWLWSL